MSRNRDRALSPAELHAFGDELDALRRRVEASLGARDARYIRRIVAAVRWTGVAGRALLFLGQFCLDIFEGVLHDPPPSRMWFMDDPHLSGLFGGTVTVR